MPINYSFNINVINYSFISIKKTKAYPKRINFYADLTFSSSYLPAIVNLNLFLTPFS